MSTDTSNPILLAAAIVTIVVSIAACLDIILNRRGHVGKT